MGAECRVFGDHQESSVYSVKSGIHVNTANLFAFLEVLAFLLLSVKVTCQTKRADGNKNGYVLSKHEHAPENGEDDYQRRGNSGTLRIPSIVRVRVRVRVRRLELG